MSQKIDPSFFWIRNISHSLLTHIMYSNVAEIAVPISCGLFPASLNWWQEFGNEILVTGVWEWDLGDGSRGMRPAAAASLAGHNNHILWCNYTIMVALSISQCNSTVYCRYKEHASKYILIQLPHPGTSGDSELAGHLQLNSSWSWVLNMHQCDYCCDAIATCHYEGRCGLILRAKVLMFNIGTTLWGRVWWCGLISTLYIHFNAQMWFKINMTL